ncbi:MAG TPA: winged helix-turn-helix domain-containing protein, partial [Thermoanaerobaculia bacterium]|nr:winged helix-turn-helix domain-containing protein [Thermoanaerobaculia bacterium]
MALLVSLAERPGEVVSREELFETVWEGAFVGDEALTTAVYQLRRALGDDARRARYVETVSKGGYRLLAPLDPLPRGSDELRPGATGSQTGARSPARPAGLNRRGPVLRWAAALAGPLLVAALALARLGPASGPGASSIPEPRPTPASLPPSPTTGQAGAEIAAATELREGWRSLERPGRDAVAAALARFERAVSLEPRDPLAHAGLAEALARARGLGLVPLGEAEPRARVAAAAAVALGPELAASHRALAYVRLTLDWDCAGAEAALDRALALEPSDPRVHSLLAQLHFVAGRREA